MQAEPQNRILAALPRDKFDLLLGRAAQIHFPQRHTFYLPGTEIKHIYFLESGMASELVRTLDGRAVDSAPVGAEGVVGMPFLLGGESSSHHTVMQIVGRGWRVPANIARECFESDIVLRTLVLRYSHVRFVKATQAGACNLLHSIEQRLARWLLVGERHAGSTSFSITQEFLAEMLGANRSTINITLGVFTRAGILNYRRGLLEILDLEKLSKRACECNVVIEDAIRSMYSGVNGGMSQLEHL